MSENQDQGFQLPSVDQASAVYDEIYADRFFAKMSSYGYLPQTQEDAMAMLQTAQQLDMIPEEKQAQDEPAQSPFVAANEKLAAHLAAHLAERGCNLPELQQKQAAEAERQNIALQYAGHAGVYGSVLTMKAAEREAAAQQS